MVLLVVDTQKLITNEKLYQFEVFESRIKTLIAKARNNNIEVIYAYVFTKISKISRIDKFTFSSTNFPSLNRAKIARKST